MALSFQSIGEQGHCPACPRPGTWVIHRFLWPIPAQRLVARGGFRSQGFFAASGSGSLQDCQARNRQTPFSSR